MVLGAVADRSLEGEDIIGKILEVTYKGKIDGKKGRRMNVFDIYLI